MALKPISRIAAGVQASTTLAIDSLFKQMKAEGKDVVGFGAGEPDFPTPEHIKQAGIEAIENNYTKYTPAAGLMELREAACYRLKTDFGLDYEPKQIVVASGAKHSVYIALMTLCNPGDEVVIAAPYWVSYSEMVKQAGAVPVIVAAEEEQDFKITAEQLDALDPSAVRAKRVGAFGCEALVRRDGVPANWSVEPVNIEQIMLFLTRGEDAR